MKAVATGLIAVLSSLGPQAGGAADAALAPFVAEYDVRYGRMAVGTSRTELSRAQSPGQWIMESASTASGFARVIAPGTLKQRSVFELDTAGPRPLEYSFDDGTERTSRDIRLEFDWQQGKVRGTAEDEAGRGAGERRAPGRGLDAGPGPRQIAERLGARDDRHDREGPRQAVSLHPSCGARP